jgi:hypothetical protein
VIVLTYTIANPWAMMVHPNDTLLANRAMMYSLFFDNIAFEAITLSIQGLNLLQIDLSFHLVLPPLFLLLTLLS